MSGAGRPKASDARLGRAEIEEAALALMAEGGAAFSMRALAAALSVSPMAIYHHVGGREALIGALADRVLAGVAAPADAAPAKARIATLMVAYCQAVTDHPALFLMLFSAPAALEGAPRRVTADLDRLLTDARTVAPPRRVRDILVDYTHGYGFAVAANGTARAPAIDEYRAGLALLLDALLTPSGGTPGRP